jgi:hypothetical protein
MKPSYSLGVLLLGTASLAMGVCAESQLPPTSAEKVIAMEEQPKRQAPKAVNPAKGKKIRYEVVQRAKARGFGQDGGVIAAIDTASGKELWTLVVYSTPYDPKEEEDVQEIYITRLSLNQDENQLVVENEARKSFIINLKTREVSVLSRD